MSRRHAQGLPLSELPNADDEDAALAERTRRERRRRRQRRSATVLVLTLALFGAATYVVVGLAKPVIEGFFESDDYPGPGTGTVEVQIEAGDTGRAIAQRLQDANVVKTADAFVDVATDDPRAAAIQPGTYELRAEMSAEGALDLLLDPASRVSIRVAVPEGLTVAETYQRLTQATGIPIEQFQEAAAGDIGLPPDSGGDPEGYLFPATYEFEPDITAEEILTGMVARHTQAMDSVGILPESRREVLIKASLIQDEAQQPEDFGKVARVIENRLETGMPLQFDSTVNFATGKSGITTSPEDRAIDSPYNTYRYPGLPPGPINSPGEQAMEAAVNPTPGDWLYFVAVDPSTGETRFAETAEEHAENVELFRQWLRENES